MHVFQEFTIFVTVSLLCLVEFSNGARILASISTPSYSHQVAFRKIWMELADRGHDVVLITTDPIKGDIKNLRQIDMSYTYEILKQHNFSTTVSNNSTNNIWHFMTNAMVTMGETQIFQMQHPEVQALIHNSSEHFDLLMLEIVFPIHFGLVERFKVPVIGLASLDVHKKLHNFMGNDDHPIMHSRLGLGMSSSPTFRDRIVSVLYNTFLQLYGFFYVEPLMNEIIKQVFGEKSRPIDELIKEVDMLFLNVNPILHPIRAVTPNTIMFGGGTHIESEPKPLPREIQKFLDSASNGAVYFSLGSNVKSALLRDDLRQVFIETLKELPYKILWKFENEELPNKPDNVMIQKWVPQGDVLRHPNVKAFITQCGLQSMEEAIMNHVPLIGLPFFADQPANAMIMKNKGFGVSLDQTTLSKDQFKEAIMEVVTNPKYKQKAIDIADLSTDVEMTGLEKVVWWTEYVIRNKGAKLFRNPIRDLPFYQYYLLDVIGFVGLICIIITFGTIKISVFLYRVIRQIILLKNKSAKNKID